MEGIIKSIVVGRTMLEERLDRIERAIESLTAASLRNEERWQQQEERWQQQEIINREMLVRIDAYQRASNQVVNLAFTLVGAATIALVGIILRLAVSL